MTEFTPSRLAELKAVAEAATYRAEPLADDVLELIDALDAKTAEVEQAHSDMSARWEHSEHLGAKYHRLWMRDRARADRAEAALERVKARHRKGTVFSHEDSCTETSEEHRREHHVEGSDIGEYYCDQLPEYVICIDCSENSDPDCGYPCPTIQSLAPEAGQRVTPSS